ncbi:MAG: LysM peptidoglycan-binding domain-containing protein [Terrimesophilobacter sp.]
MTTAILAMGPRMNAPRTVSSRLHITRRGRVVLTALVSAPLMVAAVVIAVNGGIATAGAGVTGNDFSYVTVEPGQSLWQLAKSIAPTADPRDVIADIAILNGLDGSVVHPGERLAIPAAYSK